jgi:hypothetical protein
VNKGDTLNSLTRRFKFFAGLAIFIFSGCNSSPQPNASQKTNEQQTGCTLEQRSETLRELQRQVLSVAPRQIQSLDAAVKFGGQLAGWDLTHGFVVLAGGGAVPVANLEAKDPMPHLLLYAPSDSPEQWLDFNKEDGPYQLIGWGYVAPFIPERPPPVLQCVSDNEWLVHEAGWQLLDGGMLLTPDAKTEPSRPPNVGVYMWHPQVWDIHFWVGDGGEPIISFNNPKDPGGGVELPEGSFYYLVNGRKHPPPKPNKR